MIDSSSIRVHQYGANGKKGARRIPPPGREPNDRCMGRSRGGLSTKIHALVDARGLPIALKPMPGLKRRPPFSAFLYRYLVERFFSQNLDALYEPMS